MKQLYQSCYPIYLYLCFENCNFPPKVGASRALLWEAGLVLRSGSILNRRVEFIRKYSFFTKEFQSIVKRCDHCEVYLSFLNFVQHTIQHFLFANMPIWSGVCDMSCAHSLGEIWFQFLTKSKH